MPAQIHQNHVKSDCSVRGFGIRCVMLPHFPKAYKAMRDLYHEQMFEGLFSVSPILPQIAMRSQREGQEGSFQDEQGRIRQIEYHQRSVTIEQEFEEGRGM